MNPVPEKLIGFRVYEDGTDLLGVADVKLPSIEAMTETVKGAGVAGEVDSPTLGHFKSMSLSLNWRVVTGDTIKLTEQRSHALDLRGAQQAYDAAKGEYKTIPLKIAVRAIPKKTELGKFEIAATSDSSNELEIVYIKISLDGKEVVEIDKYNFIAKINGVDYLADVRKALGL